MIEYLRGDVARIEPTFVVVDCAGVGYKAHISLRTYDALRDEKMIKLLITEVIREDEHLLYGFATEAERELFLQLTSVTGVGPSSARLILSTYSPDELAEIISLGQTDLLKAVKGIGLKMAQRIIVDLKGKIDLSSDLEGGTTKGLVAKAADLKEQTREAVEGLKALGYVEAQARKVVLALVKEDASLDASALIRKALRLL